MSADAWIGQNEAGDWTAGHDGPCLGPDEHSATRYGLLDVLQGVEQCMGQSLAWEIRTYENRERLIGYLAR